MAKHLCRKLAQQASAVALRQFLEHGKHTLALGIPHCAEPVTGHGARHQTGHVRDDEAQGATAKAADDAPKLVGRAVRPVLGHALLAHHFLKDIPELGILRLLAIRPAGVALGEEVPRPRVRVGAAAGRVLGRRVVVGLGEGVARRRAVEHFALRIVLAATGRVGERVVGVVDQLELASALLSIRRAVGNAIGMRLQCSSI